ncbi:hypothetical protein [Roseovarius mucosus]|uniref:hypothetical protein n=1 Tax=Roseovarius mucosus TaxID=215743 RepID=UPI0035CF0E54
MDWREEREKRRARSNNVDNQGVGKSMVQTLPQERGKGITAKKEKIKKGQKSVFSVLLRNKETEQQDFTLSSKKLKNHLPFAKTKKSKNKTTGTTPKTS